MITRQDLDIELSANKHSGALSRVSLKLAAHAFADPFAFQASRLSPAELLVELERVTIARVEHKLYGELRKKVHELRYTVLSSCSHAHAYDKVQTGFDELLDILRIQ